MVDDIAVSNATLEEVFIEVTKESDGRKQRLSTLKAEEDGFIGEQEENKEQK